MCAYCDQTNFPLASVLEAVLSPSMVKLGAPDFPVTQGKFVGTLSVPTPEYRGPGGLTLTLR